MAPGLFSDIGKNARDLLTRDYSYDQKFTVGTYSDAGVALTTSAVRKEGGFSVGDVAAQYKYRNSTVDVKVDTDSNILTTFTIAEIMPSTKVIASMKFPNYDAGKVEVQYFHDNAAITAAVGLNQSPIADLSATIGTPTFAVGGETGYDTTSRSFTKYNVGLTVNNPDYNATIVLADKTDTLSASYAYHMDLMKRTSAVIEIARRFSTNENTITAGGSYAVDPLTVVKARLNNYGKLGALMQHELKAKSFLTISGEFDTKALDKNPRFGLSLAMKP